MKKMTYWDKVRLKEYKRILKLIENKGEEVVSIYHDMDKNIESAISEYYLKFGVDDTIEIDNKLLDKKDLSEFIDKVDEMKTEIPKNVGWHKELDMYGDRKRIKRLESLQVQIQHEIEKMHVAKTKTMTEFLDYLANESYNKGVYYSIKQTGFKIDFDVISTRRIDAIMNTEWENTTWFQGAKYEKDKLIAVVRQELMQSAALGKSIQDMSRGITHKTGISSRSSKRLIRTMSNAVYHEAEKEYTKDIGAPKYRIDATLDDRTSDICQELDQQEFETKDYRVGETAPPFHWNCRTTTLPVLSSSDFNNSVRFARDSKGNRITVPGNWSYNDYKKEYLQ